MAATHDCVLRAVGSMSCVQMSCNREFIACPLSKTTVGVWWMADLTRKPLQLSGHGKEVSCVSLGNRQPMLLCSASEDLIYIWNIQQAFALHVNHVPEDDYPSPRCVGKDLGFVQHLSFNSDDAQITVCIGKEVWILNIQKCKLDTVLEGHTSLVTRAEFSSWEDFIVVTISEDRTFKVWNIYESCVLYQSSIISAYPFISLTIDASLQCMAVGSTDAKVRVYDLKDGNGFRCLREIDVNRMLQRYFDERPTQVEGYNKDQGPTVISSQPRWQAEGVSAQLSNEPEENDSEVESTASIHGLLFVQPRNENPSSASAREMPLLPFLTPVSQAPISDVFRSPTLLVVGTTAAILVINCDNWEVVYVLDFREPILSSSELENVQYNLPTAGCYALTQMSTNKVLCMIGSLFQNAVHIVSIRLPDTNKASKSHQADMLSKRFSKTMGLDTFGACDTTIDRSITEELPTPARDTLTVLSSTPLCANSPLKAELVPKSIGPPAKKGSATKSGMAKAKTKTSSIQDQPLTFKPKVKSSGYTDGPRTKMFSPKTSASKKPLIPSRKTSDTNPKNSAMVKEYPTDSEAPTLLREKLSLTSQPTAINGIVYSASGKHVACALANKTAHVLRVAAAGKQIVLTGHDGAVTSARFSHDDKWLLTSSTDRTVRLWSPALSDPLLVFNTVNHNFASDVGAKVKEKENPSFPKDINQASFYYVDKFVLLSCGNGLYLYKYHIDPAKDDIKRYQSNNKYKLVKIFQQERAQNITCFSCVNSFHSYIVLCCGSNKSIEVFDMNVGRSVRVLLDAYSRPVHSICQNQGSSYVSHSPEAYDLFLTAAVSDGIKLWDLRTNNPILVPSAPRLVTAGIDLLTPRQNAVDMRQDSLACEMETIEKICITTANDQF